jgi:ATP-dependent Clp protease protease subunit
VPVDVYQKLSDDRILFIFNQVDDNVAADITANLLLKDSEDPTKKISIFINSTGGDIRSVLMICDMMRMIEAPVETICVGDVMDEAVAILASGNVGMRYITKNSVVSVSQLVHKWMTHFNLTDAKKYLDLAVLDNKRVMEILAKSCKKTLAQVMKDFDRRAYLTANQAVRYGLVDKVIKFSK